MKKVTDTTKWESIWTEVERLQSIIDHFKMYIRYTLASGKSEYTIRQVRELQGFIDDYKKQQKRIIKREIINKLSFIGTEWSWGGPD